MTDENMPTTPDPSQSEQKSFAGQPIFCPKCNKALATVAPVSRLNLNIHCPFDGHDFGVTVYAEGEAREDMTAANPPAGGWR